MEKQHNITLSLITKISLVFPAALLLGLLLFNSCGQQPEESAPQSELQARALKHFEPMPGDAFTEEIPRSQEMIDLGKMLFFEPRLSKSGLISCNTCHNLATFGVDQLPLSLGHKWQTGKTNAPTVLNAALHNLQFWDGRAKDVEEQATMPILDPLEMAATEEHVLAVLASMPEYNHRFGKAFPEQENPLTYANVGNAIGAFERILLTHSAFDSFLRGDENALTEEEKQGLEVFMDAGCIACHNGVAMGGQIFTFFQTPAEKASGKPGHPGRFDFTKREAEKHFFKVPSLHNVAKTYPYMHDGSEWSLEETVRVVSKDMLGKELTPEESTLIIAFLESLTGEVPAYAMELPVLPVSTPQTPRPVFD